MSRGDSAEVRLMLAITKMRAGADLRGALADIERCMELKPSLAEAHVVHGRVLVMTAQPEKAEAAFRKALEADPKNFDALLELGALQRQQGNAEEAVATLKRALTLRSGDVPGRYQLAVAESAAGNDGRAVELLEGVIKDTPRFMEAHARLATLYFRLHKPEEAEREKAIADRLRVERDQREMKKAKPAR
jgi:Tfp pilus assembly protein PilF